MSSLKTTTIENPAEIENTDVLETSILEIPTENTIDDIEEDTDDIIDETVEETTEIENTPVLETSILEIPTENIIDIIAETEEEIENPVEIENTDVLETPILETENIIEETVVTITVTTSEEDSEEETATIENTPVLETQQNNIIEEESEEPEELEEPEEQTTPAEEFKFENIYSETNTVIERTEYPYPNIITQTAENSKENQTVDVDVIITNEEPESEPNNVTFNVTEESVTFTNDEVTVPKVIFIVPYRDRKQQYEFFSAHMRGVLADYSPDSYKIYYIHQTDTREFNRGAMKNIGFLMVKERYPADYRNITLVFNDIDIMPFTKNFFEYDTTAGVIKHFYGFVYTLGGIVSIKAGDFENIGGFPNFWAWGYEDNMLQKRVLDAGLKIDRSNFYPILDKNVLLLHSGISRVVNEKEYSRYLKNTTEGFHSISEVNYKVNEDTGFVDVSSFMTGTQPEKKSDVTYDLRKGPKPFGNAPPSIGRRRGGLKMNFF